MGAADGPGAVHKVPAGLVVHGKADQVGGQDVRGKLDALEGKADRPAQGDRQGGLAHAGHVVQEDVAVRQQSRQDFADGLPLADDDLFHFMENIFKLRTQW